jgi:predicted amidohydrolase YtcJ
VSCTGASVRRPRVQRPTIAVLSRVTSRPGRLAPGARADLIVVDRDPLTCPVDRLPHTAVLRTVLGGRTVYDTGAL